MKIWELDEMVSEIDGIILDVDGTLWDSTGIVAEAWTRAVQENGCPDRTVTADELRGLFGRTMDVIADHLLPELTPEHRYRIMKVCCVYEQQALEALETPGHSSDIAGMVKDGVRQENCESGEPLATAGQDCQKFEESGDMVGPSLSAQDRIVEQVCRSFRDVENVPETECPICYPGVQATIRSLSGRVLVFIVSNCQAGYIELFLEKTGLGAYVKDFECYGNTGKNKDENIQLLVARNGLKSPIYVGDTQGDCDAAEAAGVPFVFAKYGFGTADHAIAEIESFSELEQFAPEAEAG